MYSKNYIDIQICHSSMNERMNHDKYSLFDLKIFGFKEIFIYQLHSSNQDRNEKEFIT